MNIKMATNAQLSTTESKKQIKQISRTGTESYMWRSFGGLSAGRRKDKNGGQGEIQGIGEEIKKYKLVGSE